MAGRKIRDAAEARACFAEVGEGQTRAEWARANGIDPRSLHCWWLNLGGRRPRAPRPPLRLVELVPNAVARSSRYVVHVGTSTIEVDDHFDELTLRRLLRVVAEC